MPNFFYVKAGGTLTASSDTPYSTKQTSSFATLTASNYYATIADAYSATKTNPPAAGDFVCCSDAHSETFAADVTCGSLVPGMANINYLVSVSDSNCGNFALMKDSTGVIACINNADFIGSNVSVHGLNFTTTADSTFRTITNEPSIFWDCKFSWITNNGVSPFYTSVAALCQKFYRCEFVSTTLNNEFSRSAEGFFGLYDCAFSESGGTFIGFHVQGGTNGELIYEVVGTDLTPFETIVLDFGSANADDIFRMRVLNSQVQSGVTWANESFIGPAQLLEAYGCTDSTSNDPNTFYIQNAAGTVESVIQASGVGTDTVRTDGVEMSMEQTEYMSVKCVSSSGCSKGNPLIVTLPVRWANLSETSNDKVRVYVAVPSGGATLNQDDVRIEVLYRDGTTPAQINDAFSLYTDKTGNGEFDPLADSNDLLATDSTSTWTNTPAYKYQIDVDTSGDAGIDQPPIVTAYITKPSVTIYFDSEYDTVA